MHVRVGVGGGGGEPPPGWVCRGADSPDTQPEEWAWCGCGCGCGAWLCWDRGRGASPRERPLSHTHTHLAQPHDAVPGLRRRQAPHRRAARLAARHALGGPSRRGIGRDHLGQHRRRGWGGGLRLNARCRLRVVVAAAGRCLKLLLQQQLLGVCLDAGPAIQAQWQYGNTGSTTLVLQQQQEGPLVPQQLLGAYACKTGAAQDRTTPACRNSHPGRAGGGRGLRGVNPAPASPCLRPAAPQPISQTCCVRC